MVHYRREIGRLVGPDSIGEQCVEKRAEFFRHLRRAPLPEHALFQHHRHEKRTGHAPASVTVVDCTIATVETGFKSIRNLFGILFIFVGVWGNFDQVLGGLP